MDNTDVLQGKVSDVYQMTLMSIPKGSSIDGIDSTFLTDFTEAFAGSRLGDVVLDPSSDESRRKVLELFKEIERDLFNARNHNNVSLYDVKNDLHTLRMYLEDRPVSESAFNNSYFNVRNMSKADSEAAAVLKEVDEKKEQMQAYIRSESAAYDYTREGIQNYFGSTGILKKVQTADGDYDYVLNTDEMVKRPSEVEELMNALAHMIERAKKVTDFDDCHWASIISLNGFKFGKNYLDTVNPHDPKVMAAVEACSRVGRMSLKSNLIAKNKTMDEVANLETTADPYMWFIFDMIRDKKVSKDINEPIKVVNANAITADDILGIYNNVKSALFALGPDEKTSENKPVQFDETFNSNIKLLKPYIDFLYSDELKPVISNPGFAKDSRTKITENRKKLAGAYILTKSVYDVFNGGLMKYSATDTKKNDVKVPSRKTFFKKITENCGEFPKSDIDIEYVFNFLGMFSKGTPYFPIEKIIHENPTLYTRMCQYRKGCIEAYALQEMDRLAAKNIPVQYCLPDFIAEFNNSMQGIASVDESCDDIQLSTMLKPLEFIKVFNAVADKIAYAASKSVNDKVTEFKLWSILKKVANNTPPELGNAIKKEFINVAHAQEDWQYKQHLAIKAGVLVKEQGKRAHFSGNFGTNVNNVNIQDKRNNKILVIFKNYVEGLCLFKANEVFRHQVSMNVVMPYLGRVFDIAKEYIIEFHRNHADTLGCSDEVALSITDTISPFLGG